MRVGGAVVTRARGVVPVVMMVVLPYGNNLLVVVVLVSRGRSSEAHCDQKSPDDEAGVEIWETGERSLVSLLIPQ
jgi:hypothetical protein